MTRRIAVVLLAAAPLLLAGCGQSDTGSGSSGQGSGGACTYTPTGDAARKVDLPPSDPSPATSLKISTNRGVITATLDGSNTPCTANSFTSLAKQGYFDGTTCHRLTTQGIFVLQCGDPTGTGSGGPGYAFDDELTGQETYPAGTLAMANSGQDTNGSQFFPRVRRHVAATQLHGVREDRPARSPGHRGRRQGGHHGRWARRGAQGGRGHHVGIQEGREAPRPGPARPRTRSRVRGPYREARGVGSRSRHTNDGVRPRGMSRWQALLRCPRSARGPDASPPDEHAIRPCGRPCEVCAVTAPGLSSPSPEQGCRGRP